MTDSTVFLIPASGRVVNDPDSQLPLPSGGAYKTLNAYWNRRIVVGDVTVGNPTSPTPAPQPMYYQPSDSDAAGKVPVWNGSQFVLQTGGSGGGSAVPISFNTSVALTNPLSLMAQSLISSALTFSPAASPVSGSITSLRLVADGNHVPDFTAFKELGSSQGWDNRNGILNLVTIYYDGTDYWYEVTQQIGATSIIPTLSSATISNANPNQIALVYSQNLNATGPATSAFSVTASGGNPSVSSVAISGNTVTLTLSRNIAAGETVSMSYTVPGSNPIQSTTGIAAAGLTGQSVTNNVAAAPVLQSASIANANPNQIAMAYNQSLNTTAPATSAFAVIASGGNPTVSSVGISGSTVTLTLSRSISAGETVSLNYTVPGSNPIKSSGGVNAAALSGQSVTNNVSSSLVNVRLTSKTSGLTESGSGPYSYSTTNTSYADYGLGNKSLPASTDGEFRATVPSGYSSATGAWGILGLSSSGSNANYASFDFAIYPDHPASSAGTAYPNQQVYTYLTSGSWSAGQTTGVTAAAGDIIRLRRVGTTMYGEKSSDGGSTWTSIHTWTGATTAQLYCKLNSGDRDSGTGLNNLQGVNLT